jgi:hypothetical protein
VLRNEESPTRKAVAQKIRSPNTSVIAIQLRTIGCDGSALPVTTRRAIISTPPASRLPPTVTAKSQLPSLEEIVGTDAVSSRETTHASSLKDDSDGNDSGGDGSTTPNPGDWNGLSFASGASTASTIKFADVTYGGSTGLSKLNGMVGISGGAVTFEDSTIEKSSVSGMALSGGTSGTADSLTLTRTNDDRLLLRWRWQAADVVDHWWHEPALLVGCRWPRRAIRARAAWCAST